MLNRTSKALQKEQKHATQVDRSTSKATLRAMLKNASYDAVAHVSENMQQMRTRVRHSSYT